MPRPRAKTHDATPLKCEEPHCHLPAAQPPPVGHLQQRGVPERRQPPLAARVGQPLSPIISSAEQPLALHARQRPPRRPALIVRHMLRGVVLMTDLRRPVPDPLLTLGHPTVARISRVGAECRHRTLIVPHRRMRPIAVGDPALQILGPPTPRPVVRKHLEASHRPLTPVDQRPTQATTELLTPPPREHLLEQRLCSAVRSPCETKCTP